MADEIGILIESQIDVVNSMSKMKLQLEEIEKQLNVNPIKINVMLNPAQLQQMQSLLNSIKSQAGQVGIAGNAPNINVQSGAVADVVKNTEKLIDGQYKTIKNVQQFNTEEAKSVSITQNLDKTGTNVVSTFRNITDASVKQNKTLKQNITDYQRFAEKVVAPNLKTRYGVSADDASIKNWLDNVKKIGDAPGLKQAKVDLKEMETGFRANSKAASLLRKDTDNMWKDFGKDMKKFALWMAASTVFFQSFRFLKEGIVFVNDLNKAMTNIAMITGKSSENIKQLAQDYSELAGTLHETTLNIMQAAEEFLRAGYSESKVTEILKASTLMSKISGQDQKSTADQLIAINNAYGDSIKDLMGVVDKLTMVDNNSSTSTKELGAALERTAASAQMAKVPFEKLVAWIGTVSSVTRKSATSIGESFTLRHKIWQNRGIAA